MSSTSQVPAISVRRQILLALLATASGPVFAQIDFVAVPENACAKEYGNGNA
jgi:hypothetical protein